MSMTKVPNRRNVKTIRTSVHFIKNYFDAQAPPNTPPPSPLPNINLFYQQQSNNNIKKSNFDKIADELIDMYSMEKNNIQKLNNKIIQLTKERDQLSKDTQLLKQQLMDCEQSTQQMICHYVSRLEKERLETKKWMSIATKQEELVSTLKIKDQNNQLKSEVQANELDDKQKLLHFLIDERQILLKKISSKTQPLPLKPRPSKLAPISTSKSKEPSPSSPYLKQVPFTPPTPSTPSTLNPLAPRNQRSSIDLLEQLVKTDLIMYPLTPIRQVKTETSTLPPPPSPPPHMSLPKLPSISTPFHKFNSKKQSFHRSQPPLTKSQTTPNRIECNEFYKRETMPDKKSLYNNKKFNTSSIVTNKNWKKGHFT